MKKFDFIVVGSGLAGLCTAYGLAQKGKVALITRSSVDESNSYYAQGGMAVVTDPQDTPKDHYADTMEAGRGLCLEQAVRILTEEAPQRIEELIAMGMQFDTEGEQLALGLEGGHHHKRILHAGGDATGKWVTLFMIRKIEQDPNVTIYDHSVVYRLAVQENRCSGVCVYHEPTHTLEYLSARSVVLASGGAAALYAPTTNPPTALGDGLALAYQAGAHLADLEFVQFHPTALYFPHGTAFLISEAVRGEGAYLLNSKGERIMLGKHPLAELAPRDLVARTLFREIQRSGTPYVTLSLKHLDPQVILKRFPTINRHCQENGFDLTQEIPVAPAAHYTVGGILTDLYGRTTLPGLYAVGEVASTGVMGANRLASNSLVECLVFAHRIAQAAPLDPPHAPHHWEEVYARQDAPLSTRSSQEIEHWREVEIPRLREQLGKWMMRDVGIIRTEDSLRRATERIEQEIREIAPHTESIVYARLAQNRYRTAALIARSALLREESRGGHFREDFPDTLPQKSVYRTIITPTSIEHQPL